MSSAGQLPWLSWAIAIAGGVVCGWVFVLVWRAIYPKSVAASFWQSLPGDVQAMITTADPSEMLKYYRRLLASIARYSARSLGAIAVGLAPAAAAFFLLVEFDSFFHSTSTISICPGVRVDEPDGQRDDADCAIVPTISELADYEVGVLQADEPDAEEKYAICAGTFDCVLYSMLLFRTIAGSLDEPVVVRPAAFDDNPFWPVLSDLELGFFIAMVLGSALRAVSVRRRRVGAK